MISEGIVRIIYHHPLPLDFAAKSASGIRPVKMLQAFKELGCEVDLVVGYARDRKLAIEAIEAKIKDGVKYDFLYSESSTMPTTMTETHHFPLYPFLDLHFFKLCSISKIPISLFYRDIYWRFEKSAKGINFIKSFAAKFGYFFDLWIYNRFVDLLYLPTEQMKYHIPNYDGYNIKSLPPGYDHVVNLDCSNLIKNFNKSNLKLFYVGGMSDFYQMHVLFEAVSELPEIELTVCTRSDEWQAVKSQYINSLKNINIIHASGDSMLEHLRSSDICLLFVKPDDYWSFCSAVKLFEYTGHIKPIIASKGILDSKIILENKIGWVCDYEKDSLKQLIKNISNIDNSELELIFSNLVKFSQTNTWKDRAKKVVNDVFEIKRKGS